MRLDVEIHQQPVHRLGRVADLVIAAAAAYQFQPIQRAFAGQGLFHLALAAQNSEQRVDAQLLVVVQVLVAQCQTVNALRQHLFDRVLDQFLVAIVAETACQTPKQVDPPLSLAEKQRPAIARHVTCREPRLHTARKMGCKGE